MGVEAPETCWATHKRQVIKLWNCCILVDLFESLTAVYRQRAKCWYIRPIFIVLCQGGQMIGFVGRIFMELNLCIAGFFFFCVIKWPIFRWHYCWCEWLERQFRYVYSNFICPALKRSWIQLIRASRIDFSLSSITIYHSALTISFISGREKWKLDDWMRCFKVPNGITIVSLEQLFYTSWMSWLYSLRSIGSFLTY